MMRVHKLLVCILTYVAHQVVCMQNEWVVYNIPKHVGSTEVASVRVNQCVYAVPWRIPVLRLDTACVVQLPVCTPNHTLRLSLESLQQDTPLWTIQWASFEFTAERVDDGLWVTLGPHIYVLEVVPEHTFVDIELVFNQSGVTLWHSLDPYGPLTMPLDWSSQLHGNNITCILGPVPSVSLRYLQVDDQPRVTGYGLLGHTLHRSACVLRSEESSPDLVSPGDRWTIHTHNDTASLRLSALDLIQCTPNGTQVDLLHLIPKAEYLDSSYTTL